MKNCKSVLPIFGWVFYAIAILVFVYAVILLVNGDLEFGYENDTLTFFTYVGGAIFVASWGALLRGVGMIANKD